MTTDHHGAPLLAVEQLEALLDHQRRVGAAVVQNLRTGLSGVEMDALTEPIGIRLPAEARTLWGWHDGACTSEMPVRLCSLGPSNLYFSNLKDNVELFSLQREVAAEIDPDTDAHEWWRPSWLPLTDWGKLAIECGRIGGEAPVLSVGWEGERDLGRVLARSLGELVGWWLEAIEDGAWVWNTEKAMWLTDVELVESRYPERQLVL